MRVKRYQFRGELISTPLTEATFDPTDARFRRKNHRDPAFLDRLDDEPA